MRSPALQTSTRRAATFRTAALAGAVLASLLLVAAGVALAAWRVGGPVGVGLVACCLCLLGCFLYVLPSLVRSGMDATTATETSHPDLLATVERLAQVADTPVPQVAVVDDPTPNAATVGGAGGSLFVTTGLLNLLDRTELRAVLAHELAHVRHRDAALTTLLAIPLVFASGLLRGVADVRRTGHYHGAGMGLLVAIPALLVAAPTLPLAVCFFRAREYAADRAAVAVTGDPASLGIAIQRLDAAGRASSDRGDDEARSGPTLVGTLGVVPGSGLPFAHTPTSRRVERFRDLEREQEMR